MRVRHTKRVRSRKLRGTRKQCGTKRRNIRSSRRHQRGGWGGMKIPMPMAMPKRSSLSSMMYGGWGPAINGV